MKRLILASTSRYRRQLLGRLGLEFRAVAPGVDEQERAAEAPGELAQRLAREKAESIAGTDAVVIGSDQVASLDGRLLRKPGSHAATLEQLLACQGRTVSFLTAAVVLEQSTGKQWQHVDETRVRFTTLDRASLARYVTLEQPYDCAGGFKAEGLGISLFEAIESDDPTALMGLPLIWVSQALRRLGIDPLAGD